MYQAELEEKGPGVFSKQQIEGWYLNTLVTLTLERPRGVKWTLIGFSDLKSEAFKQSKLNFQYLHFDNEYIFWR